MNNYDPFVRFANRCLLMLAFTMLRVVTSDSYATELEVTLESGSVFHADLSLNAINWTEVQSDGQMSKRIIAAQDIRRLWLCETPASNQVAEIRELLSLLKSDLYREREFAERELSKPKIGGRFPKMLRQQTVGSDTETKYRIDRILNKISDTESSAVTEFDELELESGRILRGDAGDFEFTCVVDGQRLSLRRNQLQMLRTPNPNRVAEALQEPVPIQTEIVLKSEGKFYLPEQTTVQLEQDPLGNDLERKTDISDTYIPLGLRLASAEPGYVGISGYGFKFPDTPTGDNSAAVFLKFKSGDQFRYKKFRGTLRVTFCLPNQPVIAAGVKEFGLHIANVNHERDFIMEAFNVAGQIIATVEVGGRDCPFLGVRSNELIAELRIRANPFLQKLKRKIDDDYAFDSICFSQPMELPAGSVLIGEAGDQKANVRLSNGNVWAGNRIEIDENDSIEVIDDELELQTVLASDLIESYTFANRNLKRRPSRRSWSVQLTDGSILNVAPGKRFRTQLISGQLIPIDQAVALWPSESVARLPHVSDWDAAKEIVVLPTGRILAGGVKFTEQGYSWQTLERRLQELAPDANEVAREENPMPEMERVDYKSVDLDASPTLWLRQPRTLNPRAGYVLLRDGQRLMFGQGSLFQLLARGPDTVKLQLGNRPVEINNDRIQSVKLESGP